MKKQTKLILGVSALGAAAYLIWKSRQAKTNAIGNITNLRADVLYIDPKFVSGCAGNSQQGGTCSGVWDTSRYGIFHLKNGTQGVPHVQIPLNQALRGNVVPAPTNPNTMIKNSGVFVISSPTKFKGNEIPAYMMIKK
jgi:hypothetical protein